MGFLAEMQGAPPRNDGLNRFFLFRRSFFLTELNGVGSLSITVDGRYLLFINGLRIGRGPVRCSPLFQRYDDHDLTPYLQLGENCIAVLVHTYGVDTAFYEGAKGMWRPTFGEGGLWLQGQAGSEILDGDGKWRCVQSRAWNSDTPRVNSGLGFIEELDANMLPVDWVGCGFDDSNWLYAKAMISGGGGPDAFFGGIETRPFPTLLPRGIPHLEERFVPAQRIIWISGQISNPKLPIEARLYQEPLCPLPDGALGKAEDLLKESSANVQVRTKDGIDVTILFDFGKIVTGCPLIEIEAYGGEIIEIAASEKLPGEWDDEGPDAMARITPEPVLGLDAHISRYTARAGVQSFERFEWCAIRWMQIVIRNAPKGVLIKRIGATTLNHSVSARGRFACSDDFLTQLWAVGAYTLQQCMHDAWEDCPGREQRQWLGDATVENLVAIAAFGDSAVALNAKFLEQAAESQRPDGLTQMFAPGDHKDNGLLIPDWTLQWILNSGDHYQHSGDATLIERLFPSIQKALAWFERQMGINGLVVDMPYWHFMDWAALGRHGEAAALNAQLAGAFRVASKLASVIGYSGAAQRYDALTESISGALEMRHWDDRRGVYVDVVDEASDAQELRVSQHANAAIALWGEPEPARLSRALDYITDSNRLTFTAAPPIVPSGETLDPEDGVVLANTFYSHFVYEALAADGRLSAALDLMRQRFGPMLAKGATTLWESFNPTASLCHGFSASPTWQMSRHILGIYPESAGYAEIGFAPDIADLDWAEGVFPTPKGDVFVRLDRTADGFDAQIRPPVDIELLIASAPNWRLENRTSQNGCWRCRYVSR